MGYIGSFAAGTLFMVCAGAALAQEKPPITYIQPVQVSAANGPEMFRAYCAVCHGSDGRGGGPTAEALRKAPADLTQLSRRSGGTFPRTMVLNTIQGASILAAHGSRDMPIWGVSFRALGDDSMVKLRVANLTDFIESLQRK
jgi:mono/diheme cytochrome c family protein